MYKSGLGAEIMLESGVRKSWTLKNTHLGTAGVLDLQEEDLWPASFALGGQILIANREVPSGRLRSQALWACAVNYF